MFICLMIATAFPRLTRLFTGLVWWGLLFLVISFASSLSNAKHQHDIAMQSQVQQQ